MDYQNQQFADYHQYQQYQQQQQHPHDYNRPPTPPSPSERSNSPLNNHRGFAPQSGGGFPRSGYDELDTTLMPPRPGADPYARNTPSPGTGQHPGYTGANAMPGVQWRDPDLHEVIEFLQNPNSVIKANAAAYLQHLCYMDDPVKTKTRQLGGIPPLVALLSHDIPEIHRNACGALR